MWADRRFRWWFLAQSFSASGGATQVVGLSWVLLARADAGVALSLLTAAIFGPVLLGSLYGGTLVDRFDRRRVLLVTQGGFAVISAALAACSAFGHLPSAVVYGAALATGALNALDGPARQVYLTDLVSPSRLPTALSLYEVIINGSRVFGPAAAGLLLSSAGLTACFAFTAVVFLPALTVLMTCHRVPDGSRCSAPGEACVAPLTSAAPGSTGPGLSTWRGALAHPGVLACLLLAVATGVVTNVNVTLIPLLATRTLGQGSTAYGLLAASFGVGALLGALASIANRRPRPRLVVGLALGCGLTAALTAAGASRLAVLGAGLALVALTAIWFVAQANALAQLLAPPGARGRVMGLWNMALPGLNPLTALGAGALADRYNPPTALAASGVAITVLAIAAAPGLARYPPTHDDQHPSTGHPGATPP